jgi:hypothetical protein
MEQKDARLNISRIGVRRTDELCSEKGILLHHDRGAAKMNRKQTSNPGSVKLITAPSSSLPNFIKIEGMRRCNIAGAVYGSERVGSGLPLNV